MDNDGVLPSNSEKRFFPPSLSLHGRGMKYILRILDIQKSLELRCLIQRHFYPSIQTKSSKLLDS